MQALAPDGNEKCGLNGPSSVLALIGTGVLVPATFGDVVAATKAKKYVIYGSIGSGSCGHLAITSLARMDCLDLVHVPCIGGGLPMNDALACHVSLSIGLVLLTKPHLGSKRLRALAVTTNRRSPHTPEVPPIAKSTYAGFDAPNWRAALAPSRTPPDIVRRMNNEIDALLKKPEVRDRLAAQCIDINTGKPAAARAFIEGQIDTWAKVVRDNNIKGEYGVERAAAHRLRQRVGDAARQRCLAQRHQGVVGGPDRNLDCAPIPQSAVALVEQFVQRGGQAGIAWRTVEPQQRYHDPGRREVVDGQQLVARCAERTSDLFLTILPALRQQPAAHRGQRA
jgi:hypothetical protein